MAARQDGVDAPGPPGVAARGRPGTLGAGGIKGAGRVPGAYGWVAEDAQQPVSGPPYIRSQTMDCRQPSSQTIMYCVVGSPSSWLTFR